MDFIIGAVCDNAKTGHDSVLVPCRLNSKANAFGFLGNKGFLWQLDGSRF
nr:hypothetical protein [uncultured Rhodoferax sp.]